MSEALAARIATLPDQAGIYVFRGADGAALYVGKAKSLRKRVLSYFQSPLTPSDPNSLRPRDGVHIKTVEMVERIERQLEP